MSELEQRARERFEKWYEDQWSGDPFVANHKDWMLEGWQGCMDSVVRSIISGMEERIAYLRKRVDSPNSNITTRLHFGSMAEKLEAQIAGLKKKFGLE